MIAGHADAGAQGTQNKHTEIGSAWIQNSYRTKRLPTDPWNHLPCCLSLATAQRRMNVCICTSISAATFFPTRAT